MSTSDGDRRAVVLPEGHLEVETHDEDRVLVVSLETGDVGALLPVVAGLDLDLLTRASVRGRTGPRLDVRVESAGRRHVQVAPAEGAWQLIASRESIGAVLRLLVQAALGSLTVDHVDLYDDDDGGVGVTFRCAGEVRSMDEAELRRWLG